MSEQISSLVTEAREAASASKSLAELEGARVRYFGKKGMFTGLLRSLGAMPQEERPAAGQSVNQGREDAEAFFAAATENLKKKEREEKLFAETIDVTEPRGNNGIGSLHPVTIALRELVDLFVGMGYETVEGPEVEYDKYNFELLNQPKNHPARDAQDTFYIEENIVLRSHTSPVQARTMLARRPPIRIISAGRVYRADEFDATHSPVFHQLEGFYVDKNVTMSDLKGTLEVFAKRLFGENTKTRFRPSFFPFTEPSAEVDLTCPTCGGKGCRLCKNTGWIEMLGSGMVNPKVLELCGIDSSVYSGFAFGIGLDRVGMLRYAVPDMRWLFEGDVRMMRQFR
ncbi:MAG: phenylalanine--tRNA ligase subunit alpha [Oscillospiraceae bacterium]|nr:phenylalanine--tRNA ligase subunit alpha [Oscillospiraceae bacterium]